MGTTDLAAAVTRYENAIEALSDALPELDDHARDALVILLIDQPRLAIELGEAAGLYSVWRAHTGQAIGNQAREHGV